MAHYILRYKTQILFSLLLVAVYFPVFLHVDYMPIRMWDESILGVTTIEMGANHKYMVPHFNGSPDMWNCKPPMAIWLMLFFSKILGFNELAFRLPSALAALGLCVYLFFTLRKYTGTNVYGFIVVAILITCAGYIRNHVTRTGEYDSLLVLFATVFSLQLFWAVEATDAKQQAKHLLLFFVFLTLAVLTKSVACMMLMPGLALYVLINKKLVPFLKNKATYAGLLIFFVFGIGYYFLRETLNPGYLLAVWQNELGGRFSGSIEGHREGFLFYLRELTAWQFTYYLLFLPVALVVGLFFSDSKIKRVVLFAGITGAMFLLVISAAGTKMSHYDAPLFPYLAIIMAALFYLIYTGIRKKLLENRTYPVAAATALLCVIVLLAHPYKQIIAAVYFPKGDSWEEPFSVSCRIFQDAVRHKVDINSTRLLFPAKDVFEQHNVLFCYQRQLNEKNITATVAGINELAANDTVAVFNDYDLQLVRDKFDFTEIRYLYNSGAHVGFIAPKQLQATN